MKPGDIVKRKEQEKYGVVEYSSFGVSVHCLEEHKDGFILGKTLGDHPSKYEEYWEVVDKLPDDWEIGPYGCPIKK